MRPAVNSHPKATFQIKFLISHWCYSSVASARAHFTFLSSRLDMCAMHFDLEVWRLSPWGRCNNLDRWPLRSAPQPCAGPADSKWIFLQSPTHLHRQKQPVAQLHLWTRPHWESGTGPVCCLGDQMQCPLKCPDLKKKNNNVKKCCRYKYEHD